MWGRRAVSADLAEPPAQPGGIGVEHECQICGDCITPIDSIGASAITTIEAIGDAGRRQIQKAWLDSEVPQCGYCQSGQIMSAAALLASNPRPTDAAINDTMSGNICRCGTYVRIREAIKQAARDQVAVG